MLHITFAVIGILIGAAIAQWEGAIVGLVSGLLTASVMSLGNRVQKLESALAALRSVPDTDAESTARDVRQPAPEASPVASPAPVSSSRPATRMAPDLGGEPELEFDIDLPTTPTRDATPPAPPAAAAARNASTESEPVETPAWERPAPRPDLFERLVGAVKSFFTSGNVVVRVGLVVLFFGVAFALRYAVERNVVPVELRLAGIAAGAIVLFIIGWRLRLTRPAYGVMLQGGAIGIQYLTVFGASQYYQVIGLPGAFALMVALVAVACGLAVLQNARALATMGSIGGFLAPVLCSDGSGDHVTLFTYYTILNAGLLGVAWFKAWRSLNLIGFVFTFVVATAWGVLRYRPEHLGTTEPFLILFFLFFLGISVLYAFRQPPQLKGLVDATLVFGTPLVCFSLQAQLLSEVEFGLAYTALGLGILYLGLATILLRLGQASLHLLAEAFIALGVVFASLAVPLAFDGHWTAVTWSLEGAAVVWIGLRQQRVLARNFGLLLQIGAGFAFLYAVQIPIIRIDWPQSIFFGASIISLAGAISSYLLYRYQERLQDWERAFHAFMLGWALLWWFGGALHEIGDSLPDRGNLLPTAALALFTISLALMSKLRDWLRWATLGFPVLALLPVAACIALLVTFESPSVHMLDAWGWLVWPATFAALYWLACRHEQHWAPSVTRLVQLGSYWLAVFVLCVEVWWFVDKSLGDTWTMASLGACMAVASMATLWAVRHVRWPFGQYESDFLGTGLIVVSAALVLWTLAACSLDGDPAPLSYVPIVNPLDLAQLFTIFMVWRWMQRARDEGLVFMTDLPAALPAALSGALGFAWLNAVIARSTHAWTGVPFHIDALHHSQTFQSAIAIVWTLLALALMVIATRMRHRYVWFTGVTVLATVTVKLFLVDLSGSGTVARIVSFLAVGALMLIIGYLAPLPPRRSTEETPC